MYGKLIVDLVRAHYARETDFQKATRALAGELDRRGDKDVAQELRNALAGQADNESYEASSALPLPGFLELAKTNSGRRPNPFTGKRAKQATETPDPGPITTLYSSPRRSSPKDRPALAIPKDRDSALELFEMLLPQASLDSLVLPTQQRQALEQVVEEWRRSPELCKAGLRPTQRVLFCGPPGCGKTTAAHALAHAMGLPMAYVRLDSLVSSYLGQTSTNIRRIFDSLGDEPVVLFLDELDAIAKKRDDSQEVGELKRIVITLLQNFDNAGPNVFIFAATNHGHLLDSAIWRRFDLTIEFGLPGVDERVEIFRNSLRNSKYSKGLKYDRLSLLLAGLSGSQIQDVAQRIMRSSITTNQALTMESVMDAIIQYQTKFSSTNGDALLQMIDYLRSQGQSWRDIEGVFGMPYSTLRERYLKWQKDHGKDHGDE